ncbi:hypothetical protein T069G_09900 [Trichoderma breve]|uniref:Uncharacterized protein n=1 Tax=Trichoderma breve TaxID=2034170 RepID=A0A9W9B5W6_9HYPO|nr:hypothetical protein T069G_09900 [Trichoderma breve]KAJ4856532.1 hypothetical protein T069G_09900 [Trichoderma breve]
MSCWSARKPKHTTFKRTERRGNRKTRFGFNEAHCTRPIQCVEAVYLKSTFATKLVDAVLEGGVATVATTLSPAAFERQKKEDERQKKEELEAQKDEGQSTDNAAADDTQYNDDWGTEQNAGNPWGGTTSDDSAGNPWSGTSEAVNEEAGPAPAFDDDAVPASAFEDDEGPAFTPNDQGAAGQTWKQLREQMHAAANAPENMYSTARTPRRLLPSLRI